MKDAYDLLRNVFAPESDWSSFLRKAVGVCLAATLGVVGWMYIFLPYHTKNEDPAEEPVSVVIEQYPIKEKAVRRILQLILQLSPHIRSVWLYSWPDARHLTPVMNVGDMESPIPGSAFLPGDEPAMGTFLFGRCAELPRPDRNHTCPVTGQENSWGVVTIRYDDGKGGEIPSEIKRLISSLVYRIGLILYSNQEHSQFID